MESNGNTPYTVQEAASVLGLSSQTIRAEIRAGGWPLPVSGEST